MQLDRIRVFTKDEYELDNCHMSRARMLVRSKKASYITINDEKCLKLNKTKLDLGIKNDKGVL